MVIETIGGGCRIVLVLLSPLEYLPHSRKSRVRRCVPLFFSIVIGCSRPHTPQLSMAAEHPRNVEFAVSEPAGIDGSACTHSPIPKSDDDANCIADRGCPFSPAAIPFCSGQLQARMLSEKLAEEPQAAKRLVSVIGQLWVRPLQQISECSVGCCNLAHGTIELRDGKATALLADDRFPGAFTCSGDDSRICCGIDGVRDWARSADNEPTVVVTGELTRDASPLTLHRPRLCQIATDTPPGVSCDGAKPDVVVSSKKGTRCACYNGRARCTSDARACYLTGVWHKHATQLDMTGDTCRRLCLDGRWGLEGDRCEYE